MRSNRHNNIRIEYEKGNIRQLVDAYVVGKGFAPDPTWIKDSYRSTYLHIDNFRIPMWLLKQLEANRP